VLVYVIAVSLQRSHLALPACHEPLVPGNPAIREQTEPQARRHGHFAASAGLDQQGARRACFVEILADRPEPRLARGHEADDVPAVGLAVDATLDAYPSGGCVVSACLHRCLAFDVALR
jgi:hypothetical protein